MNNAWERPPEYDDPPDVDEPALIVGDRVVVRHDDGSEKEHEVTREPWRLGHGSRVLGLSGVSGGYSLDRVVRRVRK